MANIRQYYPKARHMVSHNKRWVYIIPVEDEIAIVDRISAQQKPSRNK